MKEKQKLIQVLLDAMISAKRIDEKTQANSITVYTE